MFYIKGLMIGNQTVTLQIEYWLLEESGADTKSHKQLTGIFSINLIQFKW